MSHFLKIITICLFISAMLAGCISGVTPPDTYVGQDGKTTIIESDKEMCQRSCNQDYSRCMDSSAAQDNGGLVDAPHGMFGASGDCRTNLQKCLPICKAQ